MVKNFKKNFIWNTIGSSFYAFASLFLLIIVTRVNGVEQAGIFTFGFSFATLLSYIGLYYGRTYQVTNNAKCNDKDFTITRLLTILIMMFCSILFIISRFYSLNKSLIIFLLCFWKASEALFENFYAIFQKNDDLYKVGISQFLKNVLGIIVFLIINVWTNKLLLSIISLIIVNYLVFIIYDIPNIRKYNLPPKYNKANILLLLKIGLYPFLISFLMMYLCTAEKFIIDYKLSDSLQTIFGIIVMPASIVALFANYIIQPFLNQIKQYNLENKYLEIKNLIKKMTFFTIAFGVLAIILGWLIGSEVLEFIYNINISNYKIPFIIILIGAIVYGLSIIFSTILTTFNEIKSQTIMYFVTSAITTIIGIILIVKIDLLGAAYTYLFSMLLLALSLVYLLIKYLNKDNGGKK